MSINFPHALTAYLNRIEAEPVNYHHAVVKIHKGNYWQEKVLITVNPDGKIHSTLVDYSPTEDEQKAIKEAFKDFKFPTTIGANSIEALLPIINGNQHYIFYTRNPKENQGNIVMVQERRQFKNGKKAYIPWVMLSNGEWVSMEPEGGLPFFKPLIQKSSMIMIHEGAKAAAAAQEIADNLDSKHPWAEALRPYEHWGMIGGALAPHRTNYKELQREQPSEVVYVADRDDQGQAALQKVSELYGGSLVGVFFGEQFPHSFDIADPMPPTLFTKKKRYIGPRFKDLRKPSTFATEMNPPAVVKGRPYPTIRNEFVKEWMHCIKPQCFIHRDWPDRFYNAEEFNSFVAPYSHIKDTASLVIKSDAQKATTLDYDPSKSPGIFPSEAGFIINTHTPSAIQSEKGDPTPFINFMEHLIPDDTDRLNLFRWCATLVCRPDIRMLYGVLLISETQGVGKSTLAEKILSPLIGPLNVSFPNEADIAESQFNDWIAHKRLAIIQEIYQGQSFKAYNRLKKYVTDDAVDVNQKYAAKYKIKNFIHFFACSNSKRALRLDNEDRRWFLPGVTTKTKPQSYWDEFNAWLKEEGGLGIIRNHFEEWLKEEGNDPVAAGDIAPFTKEKSEIIREGLSVGMEKALLLLEKIKDQCPDKPVFLLDFDIVEYLKHKVHDGHSSQTAEKPASIRRLAKNHGWFIGETRAQVKEWGEDARGARVIATTEDLAAKTPGQLALEGLSPIKPQEYM